MISEWSWTVAQPAGELLIETGDQNCSWWLEPLRGKGDCRQFLHSGAATTASLFRTADSRNWNAWWSSWTCSFLPSLSHSYLPACLWTPACSASYSCLSYCSIINLSLISHYICICIYLHIYICYLLFIQLPQVEYWLIYSFCRIF